MMKLGKPGKPEGFLDEAEGLARNHFYREALELFESVRSDRPDDPRALFGCAACLYRLGRGVDAAILLRRLIQLAPDHARGAQLLKTIEQQNPEIVRRRTLLEDSRDNYIEDA